MAHWASTLERLRPPEPNSPLNLIKQIPILNIQRTPNPRRILDRIPNQLPLFPQLQIHILSIILALDMRNIDRDQHIRLFPLQPQQCQYNRREVRCARLSFAGIWAGCLGCDQSVCWDLGSVDVSWSEI